MSIGVERLTVELDCVDVNRCGQRGEDLGGPCGPPTSISATCQANRWRTSSSLISE
jgi:hypothetical protein